MRILQVHKYLYPRDGASTYLFGLTELLKAHGHEVLLWGTDHNPPQPSLTLREGDREVLVRHLNFDTRAGIAKDFKKFLHMIWSLEAARKFERVLKQFQPDVVHVHNIYHHISPSILRVAGKYRVPVVMTVHDYHLVNPNYTLYDHGAICERRGLAAIAHRCIKDSFTASVADVIEWQVHRWLGIYKHTISRYLSPTEFVKEKLVEGRVEAGKITVVPLPVAHNPSQPPLTLRGGDDHDPPLKVRGGRGSYVLYAGRITQEKGIYLVLEMAKRLPEINFKIAGDGPEKENLALHVTRYKLHNVELLGFVEKEILQGLIAGARLVIVPSLWYDPSPLAVLEAMAAGKVVVASRIGGIPELIEDGRTGVLVGANYESVANLRISNSQIRKFDSYSQFAPQWIDAIRTIYYDEKLLARVGKAAQEYVKRVHNLETHYEKIMEIYREISNSP